MPQLAATWPPSRNGSGSFSALWKQWRKQQQRQSKETKRQGCSLAPLVATPALCALVVIIIVIAKAQMMSSNELFKHIACASSLDLFNWQRRRFSWKTS